MIYLSKGGPVPIQTIPGSAPGNVLLDSHQSSSPVQSWTNKTVVTKN